MKTNTRVGWAPLLAAVGVLAGGVSVAAADTGGSRLVIGVALPQGQLGQGADLSEPLRQALISQLQEPGVEIVSLGGGAQEQVDAEARSKNCQYVLYTRVQQKHGVGGFLGKLAPLAGALPFAGIRGGGAGGLGNMVAQAATNAATQAATNAATQAAASAMQQQAGAQLTGTAQLGIKRGDSLNLESRLIAVGSTAPVKSDTFSAKAEADGQDLLSPLAGQLASSVKAVTQGANGFPAGAGTATPSAPPSSSTETEHKGFMGGLFAHRNASSSTTQVASTQTGTMDCARIASMPNAPVSLEACQKMLSAQQTYNRALADPSASRPGDEQMSCEQIMAEVREQPMSAPDKAKTAEFQQTVTQEQSLLKRHAAESAKAQAEEQAKVDAGAAVDVAAEAATMGVVRPNAAAAAAEAAQARARVIGERQARERRPTEQKMFGGAGDIATDVAQQAAANPRLARLMQLADAHHCRGP